MTAYRPGDRARALNAFFISAVLFGLGAAAIDQATPGLPQYYFGWVIVVAGVLFLFSSAERALFRPLWAFAVAFLLEVYGWWNIFWMISDLTTCGGCNFDKGVILANFGRALPYDHGIVYMPLWAFILTTVVAIVLPMAVARIQGGGVTEIPRGELVVHR
jgi:hypothetical protein